MAAFIYKTDPVWLAIADHLEERRAELVAEAMLPATPDERRRALVARHDELTELLKLPSLANKELAIATAAQPDFKRRIY